MHFRSAKLLPPTQEVERELKKFFAEWETIENDLDFNAYCLKHGSKDLREYYKECDKIRAYYGENVRL